jgi:hypothetical protein
MEGGRFEDIFELCASDVVFMYFAAVLGRVFYLRGSHSIQPRSGTRLPASMREVLCLLLYGDTASRPLGGSMWALMRSLDFQ